MSLDPKAIRPMKAHKKRDLHELTNRANEAAIEYHRWTAQAIESKMLKDTKTMDIAAAEAYKWQSIMEGLMTDLRKIKSIKKIPIQRPLFNNSWQKIPKRHIGKWILLAADRDFSIGVYDTRGMAEFESYRLAKIDGEIRPIWQVRESDTR